MSSIFPAVAIGGPPHSGKSVLTYSLTQALRKAQIQHFVVRACPDGEGDFTHETPSGLIRVLRNKGQFSASFVTNVSAALQRRHLPLLVDVGGRPTNEQKQIFEHCTHAIIISSDPQAIIEWQETFAQYNLTLIAVLDSTLDQPETIYADGPILRGRIRGLERGSQASGPLFERLLWMLRALFAENADELRKRHLDSAPSTPVDLERLGRTLKIQDGRFWHPADLPKVLDYLPADEPLSIYGRGPNWLYATVASHVCPAPLHQFDPCLGWTAPMQPRISVNATPDHIRWEIAVQASAPRLKLVIVDDAYLDYSELTELELPRLELQNGLIFDGEIPLWLLTGLCYAYQIAPMIACFQPSFTQGPVITKSFLPQWSVGQWIG